MRMAAAATTDSALSGMLVVCLYSWHSCISVTHEPRGINLAITNCNLSLQYDQPPDAPTAAVGTPSPCRLVCSDYNNTLNDIYTNFETNYNMTVTPKLQLYFNQHIQLPINGTAATSDVALCARSYRWEWFTLFFEFCVIGSGLVATVLGTRLVHARFPLANLLSIATVLIMLAVNENITDVWFFWDQHKMFNEWAGVLQKFYYSAAALVAGWVSMQEEQPGVPWGSRTLGLAAYAHRRRHAQHLAVPVGLGACCQ